MFSKGIINLFISVGFVFGISLASNQYVKNLEHTSHDLVTRASYEEDNYYSETEIYKSNNTIFMSKDRMLEKLEIFGIEHFQFKNEKSLVTQHDQISEPGKLMGIIKKTVYVKESYDSEKFKIKRYQNSSNLYSMNKKLSTVVTEKGNGFTLTIAVYDRGNGTYSVYGAANWRDEFFTGPESDAASYGDDYIAVTWGGQGKAFRADKSDIYGRYSHIKNSIQFTKIKSSGYSGYVWSFRELSPLTVDDINYGAEFAKTHIILNRIKSTDNPTGEAEVRVSYIHTYDKRNGNISVTAGYNNEASSINLENVSNQWTASVSINGLEF